MTLHSWRGHAWEPYVPISDITDPRVPVNATVTALPANVYNANFLSVSNTNHSLWTEGDTQYVIWLTSDKRAQVSKRTLPDGAWSTFDLSTITGNPLWVQGGHDSHDHYVVGVDPDGYIHVAGNMHNDPLRAAKSANPGDITSWVSETSMIGTEETSVTYPRFIRSANGGPLFFTYREGGSGSGDQYLNMIEAGGSWQRVGKIIDGVTDSVNAYPGVHVGTDGRLHIAWCWRATSSADTNYDVCYAVRDTDGTWRKADGTAYTLPITPATAEVAVDIAQGADLFNAFGVDTDSNGRPHIAYMSGDGASHSQLYHLTWNGSAWVNTAVTNFQILHVDMGGTIIGHIAPPTLIVDSLDRPFVLLRANGEGRGGTLRVINANTLDETVLVDFEAGEMRWAIDGRAGKLRNELHFLAAPASLDTTENTDVLGAVVSVDLAAL